MWTPDSLLKGSVDPPDPWRSLELSSDLGLLVELGLSSPPLGRQSSDLKPKWLFFSSDNYYKLQAVLKSNQWFIRGAFKNKKQIYIWTCTVYTRWEREQYPCSQRKCFWNFFFKECSEAQEYAKKCSLKFSLLMSCKIFNFNLSFCLKSIYIYICIYTKVITF